MAENLRRLKPRIILEDKDPRDLIYEEIDAERERQDAKFGANRQQLPAEWLMILGEEVGEVNKAALEAHFNGESLDNYRRELIQVAAVAVAMIEALDFPKNS